MKSCAQVAFLGSVLLILAPLAAAQKYNIVDLGTFPGGAVSQGNAVNVVGQVTGYARFANFNAHGFIWSERTGMVDLGSIPPASDFSVAQGINSFGEVVGYSYHGQSEAAHAVLWSHGTLRDLGTLPGGVGSQATGINDVGQIGGWSSGTDVDVHAVIWSKQGVQDLGILPGGTYSQGFAINLEGEVAGSADDANGNSNAILWNKAAGMQALPMLPGSLPGASANGINDLGQAVGGTGEFAVLWGNDKEHTAINLGSVQGANGGTAFAINDAGQVVGWSGFTAFVWSRETGMLDLNKLIPANSGWSLTIATSINARGQITGEGVIDGKEHGFLLTPVSR
jgi:probable HAF family extracellular repeat protein